ncbi:MFS transporter [Penicillium riverlandense]|uniref:MFS transporter n=1 Tax=Penicillium riverlandense TaxID=1903569 RepID=UPI002548D65F|nr:MFS transporter [Penicillium riverlandense]KAJ5814945.1 MFS transporter [Penicillium riverlandense]
MVFGILEPRNREVRGTVVLDDGGTITSFRIKHGHRTAGYSLLPLFSILKDAAIALAPTPSNDPNDPLNWPVWKKHLVLLVVFLNTVVFFSVPAPMLAPGTFTIAKVFGISPGKVSQLSGYQLLVVACWGPFVSALARKYGKRPQFVFASLMGTIGTIVCILSRTYHQLLVGRLIQGFGTSAYEALCVTVVGDLFFVHERSLRTGTMVLTISCMASLVSIVGGPIVENYGWRYMFIIQLPFAIVALLCIFFFCPETQFQRPATSPDNGCTIVENPKASAAHVEAVEEEQTAPVASSTPMRYVQSLRLFRRFYTQNNVVMLFASTFIVALNPAVIWNGYYFSGALIGGVIGGTLGSYLIERLTICLVKKNNGVFEPEFRLPINLLSALLFGLGWFIFAWNLKHPTSHGYYLGAVCHGFIGCGLTLTGTSSSLYILYVDNSSRCLRVREEPADPVWDRSRDSFPRQTTEIFLLQMMVKSILFFKFSLFVNDWVENAGAAAMMTDFGIVTMCLMATCPVMYVFGKYSRTAVERLSILKHIEQ